MHTHCWKHSLKARSLQAPLIFCDRHHQCQLAACINLPRMQADLCSTRALRSLNVFFALGCCSVAGAVHRRLHPRTPQQLSSAMVIHLWENRCL